MSNADQRPLARRLWTWHLSELPVIWALALPRVIVLLAGLTVAAVSVPMTGTRVSIAALTTAWVLGTTGAAVVRARSGSDPRAWFAGRPSVVDAAVVVVAIGTSGGADSPLRWLLIAGPAVWVNARHPRVGLLGLLGGLGYLVASLGDLVRGDPGVATTVVGFLAIYAGSIVTARATLVSHRREARLLRQIDEERAGAERQRLTAARKQERELVQHLHDGPLQLAIAAAQDVQETLEGEDVDLGTTLATLEQAGAEMRALSGRLYDSIASDAELAERFDLLARAAERSGTPPTTVTVGIRTAGPYDELVLSIAQELLVNVRKHADATGVGLAVAGGGSAGSVVLTVTDDGVGIDPRERRRAEHDGHLGLRSIRDRVQQLGGEVSFGAGAPGTVVVVRLPGVEPVAGAPDRTGGRSRPRSSH